MSEGNERKRFKTREIEIGIMDGPLLLVPLSGVSLEKQNSFLPEIITKYFISILDSFS